MQNGSRSSTTRKMKIQLICVLFCGYLCAGNQVTEEFNQAAIEITSEESNTNNIDVDVVRDETANSRDDERDNTVITPNGEVQNEDNNDNKVNQLDDWAQGEDWVKDLLPAADQDSTTTVERVEDLQDRIIQTEDISGSQNNVTTTTNTSQEITEEVVEEPSKPKYPCIPLYSGNSTENGTSNGTRLAQARIVNATELLELVTSKADVVSQDNSTNITDGHCVFVMFYAPWCKFSIASAPHFNAIGRAFVDVEVIAVDAFQFRSLNARYGTVSVPTFLFFFNNKPVLRYNYSERTFDSFVEFLQNNTGLVANNSVNVSDIDYEGPVPSILSEEPDYALWFSGIFLLCWWLWIIKVQYGGIVASKVEGALNYMRHIWRTGEFYEQVGMLDHEHVD